VLKGKKKLLRLLLGIDTSAMIKELVVELNKIVSYYVAVWESTNFKK
jgi:hypothetical protein